MDNFINKLSLTEKTLRILGGIFDKNDTKSKLKELEQTLQKENFWKDKELVKKTIRQKKILENILNSYQNSIVELTNIKDLYGLANQEDNSEIKEECLKKIDEVFKKVKDVEINCFLSGENDDLDIYLEIHAGAGGTESQDWLTCLECI